MIDARDLKSELAEDPRVTDALEEYLGALESGDAVDRDEFLSRHSEIATELTACLDGLDFVHHVAPQFHGEDSPELPKTYRPDVAPIGDFRIIREIGRGGMGVVYEAEQMSLGRSVALKVLPYAAMLDPRQLQRFKNEAMAAAQLTHPNIVRVISVGNERGVHYYAMDYIDGQTLSHVIGQLGGTQTGRPRARLQQSFDALGPTLSDAEQPVTPQADVETAPIGKASTLHSRQDRGFFRTVAELGRQVAEALDHAHQQGVIHRDIKPSNLILDAQGKVWVTDFGLAQIESNPGLTMSGDLLGTLRYMSPEQAMAKRIVIDHRTDVYSLGVTLYELLTLRPVFPGNDRQELLRQIAFDEPMAPRRINPAIPTELETIVLKAIAKDPRERYATAQDLADDLESYLEHRPIKAKPPSLLDRTRKWSQRHTAVVWSVAAVLLLTTIAMGVSSVVILRAYEGEAEAREDAETQARIAAGERDRAEANLARAMEVVDTMVTRFADEQLSATPGTAAVREELFRDALRFYEEFLIEDPQSTELRLRMAAVHLKRATVFAQLNERRTLQTENRLAFDLYDSILESEPLNLRAGIGAVDAILAMRTDTLNGRSTRERCVEIVNRLRPHHEEDPEFRDMMVKTYSEFQFGAVGPNSEEQENEYVALLLELLDQWDNITGKTASRAFSAVGFHQTYNAPFHVAETYLRTAVQLDGESTRAHLLLGDCLRRAGKLDAAVDVYMELFRLESNSRELNPDEFIDASGTWAQRHIGNLVHLQGRSDEFINRLTQSIDSGNGRIREYLLRGDLYANQGHMQAAAADYSHVYHILHDGLSADRLTAALFSAGDFDPALEMLKEDVTCGHLDRLSTIEPSRVLEESGESSRREFLRTLDAAPVTTSSAFSLRGRWYAELGERHRAIRDFTDALSLDERNTEALENRAFECFRLQRYDEALSDLDALHSFQPQEFVPFMESSRGTQLMNCADEQWQLRLWKLLDQLPESKTAYVGQLISQAKFLIALGRTSQAAAAIRIAFSRVMLNERRGNDYSTLSAIALMSARLGQSPQYCEICEKMLADVADSETSMEAQVVVRTCSFAPNAVQDYAAPLALAGSDGAADPTNQRYLISLGAIQFRAGMHKEALATFERASAANEDDNTSSAYDFYFRAMAEHALERSDDSRQSLATANRFAEAELAASPAWNRKLTLELLRAEAEGLISVDDAGRDIPPPPPQTNQ